MAVDDLHISLFRKYSTPFRIVSEGVIQCAPNPALAESLRASAKRMGGGVANESPVFVQDIADGQRLRKVFALEAYDSSHYEASVEHVNNGAKDCKVKYVCSDGAGLIIEDETIAEIKLREPSLSIFSSFAVGFPQARVVTALPYIQKIRKGDGDGRVFIDLFFSESAPGKLRVFLNNSEDIEELLTYRNDGKVAERVKVTEWMKKESYNLPKIVTKQTFNPDGSVRRSERWENKFLELSSRDREGFVYDFRPGFLIRDTVSGSHFWSNDVLKDGWRRDVKEN